MSNEINLIIQHDNGDQYNLEEEGINVLDFSISSPDADTTTSELDGVDGFIDQGTRYEGREMTAELLLLHENFTRARNQLFRIFDSRSSFYVIDEREDDRRWRCKVDGGYTPERVGPGATEVEIDLVSDFTYSESIDSTMDDEPEDYTFNETSFSVYNDGDVEIDPRVTRTNLVVEFTGASEYIEIHNQTTGDSWEYDDVTDEGDVIELDGVRATKNGESIFRDTNASVLRLQPGENNFQINNTTGDVEISFDFHKFYL